MMARLLNSGLVVAGLIAVCAVWVLIAAYSYQGISGTFPQLVGWIFLGLALLELAAQVSAVIRPANPGRSADEPETISVVKELKGFGWLGILLLALYLVGFLISTPLYVFAFLRLSGRLSLVTSSTIAVGATVFVYVVFVQLLEYKLFPGVLLMG
ncbi:MAG: tripartite tricarboxylate transporter TctB family protein [Marinobacter sp.]|uniref:tripartite tricarboxylate transporter TctB family protein n=1 Tax=Marinobacter sp. TaxID=50741 RepID=UPI0034A056DE